MSTFKNKNSLRKIEAQIVQKLKNNEVRPKFTGSYKKSVYIVLNDGHEFSMLQCLFGVLPFHKSKYFGNF